MDGTLVLNLRHFSLFAPVFRLFPFAHLYHHYHWLSSSLISKLYCYRPLLSLCSSLFKHFLSLSFSYLILSPVIQIGDDTFQLEPSLLEDLTAQIASLASIYHKPGIHFNSFNSLVPHTFDAYRISLVISATFPICYCFCFIELSSLISYLSMTHLHPLSHSSFFSFFYHSTN